jgi:hypothetical protein
MSRKIENGNRAFANVKALPLLTALLLAGCSHSSQGLGVYPKAVGAADEGFAIQTLKLIATAQAQAKVTRGSYGDFKTLAQSGFLDQRFADAAPTMKGYQFTMTASDSEFVVNADPTAVQSQTMKGGRHFYLDSSDNSIHVNATQAATKSDPIL